MCLEDLVLGRNPQEIMLILAEEHYYSEAEVRTKQIRVIDCDFDHHISFMGSRFKHVKVYLTTKNVFI